MTRLRNRLRGAWMWPTLVLATVLDAVIGHALPPVGDGQSLISAGLIGLFANLVLVVIAGPAGARLVRLRRPDLPRLVATDYAGTTAISVLVVVLLAVGVIHRGQIRRDHAALADATARAQTWIAAHAPGRFRDLRRTDVFQIQPPRFYRVCVAIGGHSYCVVVDREQSRSHSVRPDGSEPNAVMEQGTN